MDLSRGHSAPENGRWMGTSPAAIMQSLSIGTFNSGCEEPQTCPPGPKAGVQSHEERRRALAKPPSSHSVEGPGSYSDEPTGLTCSWLRQSRSSHGPS
ncbi:hypothetical protein CHARACLAT_032157 [Characodon lateralis]|uniref:Uncharacterized protein n=1 Tax=Characodon lateralis TaxID=208331 RepID=A0ABU7ERU9_9TELE|nr:hypothetical protein [Characodon lateralis]